MGDSLGGIFSGTGQGDFNNTTGKFNPSALQTAVQGAAKGAGQGMGQSMQQQPQGGGGMDIVAPGAMPVDAGFFSPTNFQQNPQLQPPGMKAPSALYGGG